MTPFLAQKSSKICYGLFSLLLPFEEDKFFRVARLFSPKIAKIAMKNSPKVAKIAKKFPKIAKHMTLYFCNFLAFLALSDKSKIRLWKFSKKKTEKKFFLETIFLIFGSIILKIFNFKFEV